MKMDIVIRSKLTYDDKFKLLRKAVREEEGLTLDLRRGRFTHAYHVTCGFEGKCFSTRFFANKCFERLCRKYGLKEVE